MKRHTPIDWQSVRAQLDRNRAAAEAAVSPDAARIQDIYRERAARLARAAGHDGAAGESRPVLVFRLGAERYGFELSHVVEILARPRCSPVPGAPPQLAGVLQTRGEIRPVWELTRLLQLPDLKPGDPQFVLILRILRHERGLRVNRVEGVEEFRPEDHPVNRGDSPHVKWITPDLVTVLDPNRLWKEES